MQHSSKLLDITNNKHYLMSLAIALLLPIEVVNANNNTVNNILDTRDNITKIRGGTEVVGHNGIVEINGNCTGWILNERVIITAAHCLSEKSKSGRDKMKISYFSPTVGKKELWNAEVRWEKHPDWKGNSSTVDLYDNDFAIKDIGYILNETQAWPDTSYLDYLRVYQDYGNRIDKVRVWGRGYNTYSGRGIGTLRHHLFSLNWDPTKNVIETEGSKHFNMCKGDSGGPAIKEVGSLELVAGVNSAMEHQWFGSENCSRKRGDQWHTRINGANLNWILSSTNSQCKSLTAYGYKYKRCFDIPFINDVPYEGLDKNTAVGIIASIF